MASDVELGVDLAASTPDTTVVVARFTYSQRCFRFAGPWPVFWRQVQLHNKRARGRERYRRRYERVGRRRGK